REVLAAGRVRVPAADPAHGDGKVPQGGAARATARSPLASSGKGALLKPIPLLRGELDQRRPHRAPRSIAGAPGARFLQRGDERELLEGGAHGVDLPLPLLAPLPEGARDGGGVHVRGGRDAAGAPFLQVGEEELLAADEHLEAGKGAKHRARILEVAGAVLHSDDNARISL